MTLTEPEGSKVEDFRSAIADMKDIYALMQEPNPDAQR